MPNATTKANPVVYLPISSVGDIGNAIAAALGVNYSAHVFAERIDSVDHYTMTLTGPGNPEGVTATFGDVYVWHPEMSHLESMSETEFLALYTPEA